MMVCDEKTKCLTVMSEGLRVKYTEIYAKSENSSILYSTLIGEDI